MICMFKTIHYCYLIYLRNLEICLNTCELDPVETHSAPGLAWQAALKEHLSKIRSFNRIDMFDMLLMVEKGNRGGIFYSIYRYAKANDKYRKNYDKNKELSISSTLGCK